MKEEGLIARLRQRFLLTAKEKQVVVFVVSAFLVGVTTKYYRDTHPTLILKTNVGPKTKKSRKKPNSPAARSTPDSTTSDDDQG